jgi:long-chain acyl-CoA synthetase
MSSVDAFLTQWRHDPRTYIIDNGRAMGYAQANDLVGQIRECLVREDIREENAALVMENSSEYVLAYFANRLAGSTNIPLNPKLTKHEVTAELRYCDCNWIITDRKHSAYCLDIADELGLGVIELQEGCIPSVVRRPQRRSSRCNSSEIVVMLHTSGTTGDPKKVMLSEENLCANTQAHIASLALTPDDVVLVALPMLFVYCHTTQLLVHTRLGGTIVLYDEPLFTAKRFCELIQTYRITCFSAVPGMLVMLDRYGYLDRYDLSSLRYLCFGCASTPPQVLKRLMARLPHVGFVHTYGQTECGPRVTSLLPQDSVRKMGSIGQAIPGVTLDVVNPLGLPVAPGEIGEIRVSGKSVTSGYYKKPAATGALIRGSYLYTGDLARLDDDGFVYLAGRKKTVIISGGINIYPEEVEQALLSLPFIDDALVFGEENPYVGEAVAARVVPAQGESVTLQMVHQGLADLLAQYKWPKRIYVAEKVEKTPTGKTRRIPQVL